jgi:hypothetical protein
VGIEILTQAYWQKYSIMEEVAVYLNSSFIHLTGE